MSGTRSAAGMSGAGSTGASTAPAAGGETGIPNASSTGTAGTSNASGGDASSGHGDLPPGGTAGGSGLPGDCSAHDAAATYYSETQHCYLVVHDQTTYASAQSHCLSLGAHLATIANDGENDFVWKLDPVEHWIGTSDGKDPREPDPGTYSWVTGEPFDYTAWSGGQPNATKTSCGDANGGGDCYEHCGFQWTGGEKAGLWNDRYCLHTIESICEWDR